MIKTRLQWAFAWQDIMSAKLRSALAMLGIIVGTAAVVALISTGEAATEKALKQFKSLGTDLLSVSIYEKSSQSSEANLFGEKEALDLQKLSPDIQSLSPYTLPFLPVSFEGKRFNARVIGAKPELYDLVKIQMSQGRFISFLDEDRYFAVIGDKMASQLNETNTKALIGDQIKLGDNFFTIIGIAEPWIESSFFNENIDNAILIPLSTSFTLSSDTKIRNILFRVKESTDIDVIEKIIQKNIETKTGDARIFFRSAKQLIENMGKQRKIFTLLLASIAGIALFVAGIGVMNIMLVAVSERRREIGIRIALGAREREIMGLFLAEAISLTTIGGLLGVGLGLGITWIISHYAQWDFMIFYGPMALGFFVSLGIGIFFGFYPALRAAKLDPIRTLRVE